MSDVDLEDVGTDELNHLVEELIDRPLAARVGGIKRLDAYRCHG